MAPAASVRCSLAPTAHISHAPTAPPTPTWQVSQNELYLTALLVLLTALKPYASLPPPCSAPPTWVHYPGSGRYAQLNTSQASNASLPDGQPAPSCCIQREQMRFAAELGQAAWQAATSTHAPWRAAAEGGLRRGPDGRPLLSGLGGVRPMAPAPAGAKGVPSGGMGGGPKLPLPQANPPSKDDEASPKMALWKKYMTTKDRQSIMVMPNGADDPSEDIVNCRKLPWPPAWDCLWNTAWFGPHGFLYGNNLQETDDSAQKAGDCHCYFKWFFEKPAHLESGKDKKEREQRETEGYGHGPLNYIIPGKNLFVHLFFGILFGWLLAVLNSMLTGGSAPWIRIHQKEGISPAL